MWSHAGSIITNAARVYYLPDNECLPPLRWKAESQSFVYVNSEDNSEDAMIRATLVNLATTAASPAGSAPLTPFPSSKTPLRTPGEAFISLDAMSNSITCECLYGVVPIGAAASVLLYVTSRSHVTTLTLPEPDHEDPTGTCVETRRHEVYAVRRLEWLQLPSRVSRSRSCVPTPMVRPADCADMGDGAGGPGGGSEDDEDTSDRVPEEVLRGYLATINHFCENVSSYHGEHAYLYYSPTVNLALNPEEILRGKLRLSRDGVRSAGTGPGEGSRPPSQWPEASLGAMLPSTPSGLGMGGRYRGRAGDGEDGERAPLSSRRVFQWNHMLLSAFMLPSEEVELENEMSLAASTRMVRRRAGGSAADPSVSARSAYPWGCVSMLDEDGQDVFDATPLYIPRFIRGLVAAYDVTQESPSALPTVQLHLVTRLSARWAGTRYNRRGLEPGSSGVPANCAVTSLWVGTRRPAAAASPGSGARADRVRRERVAVLSLVRGSVPRRWEQPADFHFKPPLKVSGVSSGADELLSHLRFLHRLLPDLAKVSCLDTTSSSTLEAPLSDAFASAVARVQRDMVRGLPFEPFDEDQDGTPRDSAGTSAARNGKTPVGYLKYNMKAKLKSLCYGALRRDVLRELDRQRMGFCPDACEVAVRRRAGHTESGADLPAWLDFTECGYDVGGGGGGWLRPQCLYYRVNCLDCLDRTNLMQALLAESALPYMLDSVLDAEEGSPGVPAEAGRRAVMREKLCVAAATALRRLVAQQGVALSQMYANSEAHYLSFLLASDYTGSDDNNENTRYRTSIDEPWLALRRWFFQNMRDGRKQDGVSLVTLQHDPALYPSDIESPFSRDFSSMNALVLYGVLFAIIPFVFSVVSVLFLTSSPTERNVHMALCSGWIVYFAILAQKLSRYRVTYTNQPLLHHTST